MHRLLLTAALVATPVGASAGSDMPEVGADCAALGIPDPAVAFALCAELEALGSGGTVSRGLGVGSGSRDAVLDEWPDLNLVQDAFRADPRKTLELIRRIKDAGGLTTE